ncbi:2-hydroxychromene-2-carboxylate isomerase [Pandoraea sp.]|uniref:2-hydroxychromene-2-carboxylate isomerase n=1 Tax=Pandoraea sp. TaxID=1883445 RepID=UPI00120B0123|nr:2-hydroxychromene-2-carboxylate isomerase [Pandoraea sp.]TAL52127.1 MAG: 2-hydroxychromene-2-carboxylate isomerase [Pandoraea sp.]TAM16018.1 MAG: 2-hydroxychromene-2-carboxylate isomerase [Pandoraea sp.]
MTATSAIDFYFDFSSPYGYFASTVIDQLAARHGRSVQWHPILLGAIFKTTGMQPPVQYPLKGDYIWHDFARSARFHDIPYRRPSRFPLPTQAAARATLWAHEALGDERAVTLAKAIYRGLFVDDIDISEPAEVVRIGTALGIDGSALEQGIQQPSIKEQLKTGVEQALARGVFGSPYVIVDGEPFWGFDRFAQIEAFLQNGKI